MLQKYIVYDPTVPGTGQVRDRISTGTLSMSWALTVLLAKNSQLSRTI